MPAAGAPRPGGSTVWAADADPSSLDPHAPSSDAALQAWGDLTYQSLTMFDEKLRIVPALAESWTHPDPTTWIFNLRRGVRFHDGHELDAEDVVFWHQRVTATATGAAGPEAFARIQKVEPAGTYSVRMTLSAPHAPLLVAFAGLRGSAIVSRRSAAQVDLARQALGTGPFRIAEYVPGSHITYLKHADYWEHGLPYLDTVTLKLVAAGADRVAALRDGRVRYASVSPDEARQLADARDVRVLAGTGPRQWVHHLNTARAPFHDVGVRRAVALALDRRAVVERVFGGQGALTGPIPTGLQDWALPSERLAYHRDLSAAKDLLVEAGLDGGFATVIVTTADSAMLGTSTALAEQLRGIGIRADVHRVDRGALLQLMQAGDYDIVADGSSSSLEPDDYLTPIYRSGGPRNVSRWSSEAFDELVDHARTAIEPPERKRLYDDAQAILLQEVPSIWWCTENTLEALHASHRGYAPSFAGRRTFLKTTWLDRK